MAVALKPINIIVEGSRTAPYKSITDLRWDKIPGLAVLTGLNGSGKTQLLEILAFGLTRTLTPQGRAVNIDVRVEGDELRPQDIAYLPSNQVFSAGNTLQFAQMANQKIQLHQQLVTAGNENNLTMVRKRRRLELELGQDVRAMSSEEFSRRVSDNFFFMLDDVNIISSIAYVFMAYRLKALGLLENGIPKEILEAEMGPAPWNVINESLAAAAFPYSINSPEGTDILDPLRIKLRDVNTGKELFPDDLSSGEKVILEMILWLFSSAKQQGLPKLFLMDEPDAHLHPSMTRQFLDVIYQVLVQRYGIRVIITTHSPSTVALAPEGCIFEMKRFDSQVRISRSKADTLAMLTAGLVVVFQGSRYVLVEDQDDINFYSALRDILTDYGPRRDHMSLPTTPSITFLPASTKKNASKIGGGCTVVNGWVNKLDTEPLETLFRGLTDRDESNVDSLRVYVTGRHSIENYLVDPFNVYAVLSEANLAPIIEDMTVSAGDEHLLGQQSLYVMQKIVDTITSAVSKESSILQAFAEVENVTFTNEKSLAYPKWMIDHRGHDLLPLFQKAWHGHQVISPPKLLSAFRKVRLVPKELAQMLAKIQR